MRSNFVRAALACLALALPATAAFAVGGMPVSDISVGLEGDPGSIVVARGVTDDKGQVDFGNVMPGKYRIVIDGPGLASVLKRIDPKGLPHVIRVVFGIADKKPFFSSGQPYAGGSSQSISISGIIVSGPDTNQGDLLRTKPHHYVGIVSLLK